MNATLVRGAPTGIGSVPDGMHALVTAGLLPVFRDGSDRRVILESDLDALQAILDGKCVLVQPGDTAQGQLFHEVALSNSHDWLMQLAPGSSPSKWPPYLYAAYRNLARAMRSSSCEPSAMRTIPFPGGGFVQVRCEMLAQYVEEQVKRERILGGSDASQFANTAYYMGSKRSLAPFVVEALHGIAGVDAVAVDLMCGSGAVAGALSRIMPTYAADAQRFAVLLAQVQGGGFTPREAEVIVEHVSAASRVHAALLQDRLQAFLDWEDRLLHHEVNPELIQEYFLFRDAFPLYGWSNTREASVGLLGSVWDPTSEVECRRRQPAMKPWCLFTAYFANVYFGVRQCIELDSLRYAIDTLEDPRQRSWALGALIVTASALGSTYGGHFAQPIATRPESTSPKRLNKILEQRAYSVHYEWTARLLALAKESAECAHVVQPIRGPWEHSIQDLSKLLRGRSAVAYIDAPYTREEYSRYYHVLETLVSYDYPSSTGSGRVPDKARGERFRSEFFSKSVTRVTDALVHVIRSALVEGWSCGWSYSDTGIACIPAVIRRVQDETDCRVEAIATPYAYKSQGGSQAKQVTEYLTLFSPRASLRRIRRQGIGQE